MSERDRETLRRLAHMTPEDAVRVEPLEGTRLALGPVIETIGTPEYITVEMMSQPPYNKYALYNEGWYVFARINNRGGQIADPELLSVEGVDACIFEPGKNNVDIAVRFDATAKSREVVVDWGSHVDVFTFKATDHGLEALDYRTTFYLYDAAPYATWQYSLTEDTTFAENKNYYTLGAETGEYTLAEVTAGEEVPADTYYQHSKLHFEGMVQNVTYAYNEIVDAPIEIVLPVIPEDGHGAWYEIQMRYNGSYSMTLLPPEGVKIGTAQTQAQTEGINTVDLQYTAVGGVKMWTLLNTHANIPA